MGFQPSVLTFIVVFFLSIELGLIIGLFLFAPLLVLTGLKVHKCKQCNNTLGKSKKIINHVEFLEDRIHSIAIGELAFVISRRLILNICLSFLLILFFAWKIMRSDPVMGEPSQVGWAEFRQDCGNNVFRTRPLDAHRISNQCQYRHSGSTFQNWQGHVIKIHDNRNNYFDYFHSLKLLVAEALNVGQNGP